MKDYRITVICHDDEPSTVMELTNEQVTLIRQLADRIDEAGRSTVSPSISVREMSDPDEPVPF